MYEHQKLRIEDLESELQKARKKAKASNAKYIDLLNRIIRFVLEYIADVAINTGNHFIIEETHYTPTRPVRMDG